VNGLQQNSDSRDYIKALQAVNTAYNSAVAEVTNECWTLAEMINANEEEE
jgi:hypothetical protein